MNVGNDGKNGGKNGSLAGRIIDILREEPQITMPQMAAKAGTSLRSVEREMKILRESGCIERADGRRYGYWKIIDKYHDLFELKYDKKRNFIAYEERKGGVKEQLELCGYFCIATSKKMTAAEALMI